MSQSPIPASSTSPVAVSAAVPVQTLPVPIQATAGPDVASTKAQMRFDLHMDLVLLRHLCFVENPFVRGSSGMEETAKALAGSGEAKFVGLTKKAVRDRALLLLDQHGKADAKKRKGSGTDEEYGELERLLLTELRDLQLEKDKAKQPAAQADRARAEALREEACSTLASKSLLASKSAEPPAKRAKLCATEVVTACIREKNEREAEAEKTRMTLEERKVAIQKKKLESKHSLVNI